MEEREFYIHCGSRGGQSYPAPSAKSAISQLEQLDKLDRPYVLDTTIRYWLETKKLNQEERR